MKRFIKVTLIIGVVCLFIGAGIMGAGMVMGGSLEEIMEYEEVILDSREEI